MEHKLKIFTKGFYVSLILWMCGIVASMVVQNTIIKLLLIIIPLAIYCFFLIGKSIIEEKMKNKFFLYRGGKQNRKSVFISEEVMKHEYYNGRYY